MDCKGCLRSFDAEGRQPRILVECGHSVCLECLRRAMDQAGTKFSRVESPYTSKPILRANRDNQRGMGSLSRRPGS